MGVNMLHSALRRVPAGTRVPILSGPARGLWWRHDPRYPGYTTGGYERHVQAVLAHLLRPGALFVDIGAHQGFYTVLGARLVGRSGRVVAVEPRAENVDRIYEHLRLNALDAVVFAVAASDRDGEAAFDQVSAKSDWGTLAEVRAVGKACRAWEPVPGIIVHRTVMMLTLDAVLGLDAPLRDTVTPFVKSMGMHAVVKCDCEGAEAQVLRGAREFIRQVGPDWVLSVHGTRQLLACLELLGDAGYVVETIREDDVLFAAFPDRMRALHASPAWQQLRWEWTVAAGTRPRGGMAGDSGA